MSTYSYYMWFLSSLNYINLYNVNVINQAVVSRGLSLQAHLLGLFGLCSLLRFGPKMPQPRWPMLTHRHLNHWRRQHVWRSVDISKWVSVECAVTTDSRCFTCHLRRNVRVLKSESPLLKLTEHQRGRIQIVHCLRSFEAEYGRAFCEGKTGPELQMLQSCEALVESFHDKTSWEQPVKQRQAPNFSVCASGVSFFSRSLVTSSSARIYIVSLRSRPVDSSPGGHRSMIHTLHLQMKTKNVPTCCKLSLNILYTVAWYREARRLWCTPDSPSSASLAFQYGIQTKNESRQPEMREVLSAEKKT